MASNYAQPERQVARTLLDYLRRVLPPGSVVCSYPAEQRGAGRTAEQRARYGAARKRSGVLTGHADLVAYLPGAVLVCEVKAPGGVVSLAQQGFLRRMRSLGHAAMVADGVESCRYELDRIGMVLREAPGQPMRAARVRYEHGGGLDDTGLPPELAA